MGSLLSAFQQETNPTVGQPQAHPSDTVFPASTDFCTLVHYLMCDLLLGVSECTYVHVGTYVRRCGSRDPRMLFTLLFETGSLTTLESSE